METIITTLLVMGLQASILAIIIIAFRGMFRKIPKIYVYVLWLVMLIRLAVPVIFESDYGVTPSPDRIVISATAERVVLPNTNANTSISPGSDTTSNQIVIDKNNQIVNDEVTQNGNTTQNNTPTTNTKSDDSANTNSNISFWQQSWFLPIVCIVWGAGTITVLLMTALQYFAMKRKLQFAIKIGENIWECETVKSPFVMGVIRPKIYLPINLPADEKEHILLHEQMHIKHLDPIVRLFMTLATAIHWWNPIVWLSMDLMKKDMEMLCDESTTKTKEPEYRKAYSMTLLKYAAKNSGLSPVLSFGESNTERRVKHLMFLKKPKFYVSIIMVLVMSLCLMSCIARGVDGDEKPSYIPEETVTLKLYSDMSSYNGIQQGWFADVMLEKFNVKLDIIMSSDEMPDNQYSGDFDLIISGRTDNAVFTEAMEQGYFLDLSSDMETYMPYISEHLEKSLIRYSSDATEHIYAIRTSASVPGDYDLPAYTWNLRYDYYEELGKPVISDLNDWVSVLEQMKEKHPTYGDGQETYGIACYEDIIWQAAQFVCGYYGHEQLDMGFYDWGNNEFYGLLAMEADGSYGPFLQMLKLNNELYRKDLLNVDEMLEAISNNSFPVYSEEKYFASLINTSSASENNRYPVIPTDATSFAYELGSGSLRSISIDSQTKYPELCMAILDYFYSPEGVLTMTYGPEGDCWYYDENGYTCLTTLGVDCQLNGDTTMLYGETFWTGCPMFNITSQTWMATNTDNDERYYYQLWESIVTEPSNEVEEAWREWVGFDSIDKYLNHQKPDHVAPGILGYFLSETEISETYEAVMNIITTKAWEAVSASTDAEFDAIVQDMITLATQAGYEECVEYSENLIQTQLEQATN